MSNYLSQNLKYLRKESGLTQEDFAQKLSVNRPSIGAYEEGRAEPKLETLQNIALYFKITLDELINTNIALKGKKNQADVMGNSLRILPVSVDKESGKEQVVIVPVKAAAGYLDGFSDVDFIRSLPSFSLPIQELGKERTYRLFQIKGDSMKPIPEGSYIITEYMQDWRHIKDNHCYILITKDDGIVYKRVLNRIDQEELVLKSDNPEYKPYSIGIEQLAEVWKAVGYISLELPDANGDPLSVNQVMHALIKLQQEVTDIKQKLN